MNGKVTEIRHESNLEEITHKFIKLIYNKSNVEEVLRVINSLITLFDRGELVHRKTIISNLDGRFDLDVDTKASKVNYSGALTSRRPNGFPKLLRETRRHFKEME